MGGALHAPNRHCARPPWAARAAPPVPPGSSEWVISVIDELRIKLENCHGIRLMDECLPLSRHGRHAAIYSSNGTMKTSLARTLRDIGRNDQPRDHIYTASVPSCSVTTGSGGIDRDSILVVDPYEDIDISRSLSSGVLVSSELRSRYDAAHASIAKPRQALLDRLHSMSGVPRKQGREADTAEELLVADLAAGPGGIFAALEGPGADPPDGWDKLAGIKYHTLFNQKAEAILKGKDFRTAVERYIDKYEELIAKALYFYDVFDHTSAEQVCKSLDNSGFFKAGHSLGMKPKNGARRLPVLTLDELEAVLGADRQRVHGELDKEWNEMDKMLVRPREAAALKDCLVSNRWLIPMLGDLPRLKAGLWRSYLAAASGLADEALSKYRASKSDIDDIVEEAGRQTSKWEKVVKIFRTRFPVPFEVYIENKPLAVIKAEAPRLMYRFRGRGGEDAVPVVRDQLDEHLSTGEKRAFYLLNVLFEIERRRDGNSPTLVVLDDVADSFDYKNKYAIIEYLKDLSDDGLFQLVILTHNFDFFRTIVGRGVVSYGACRFAEVDEAGRVTLAKAEYIKNPLDDITRDMGDPRRFIAAIPFARNMVEYSLGKAHPSYGALSDTLHWRSRTGSIRTSEVWGILCDTFPKRGDKGGERGSPRPPPCETVHRMLVSEADKISGHARPVEGMRAARPRARESGGAAGPAGAAALYDKITLSVAIRVLAEKFLVNALYESDAPPPGEPAKLPSMISEYKARTLEPDPPPPGGGADRPPPEPVATLEKVALMTPEAIHLNSFMYEPILDMSGDSLVELYRAVRGLGGEAGGA